MLRVMFDRETRAEDGSVDDTPGWTVHAYGSEWDGTTWYVISTDRNSALLFGRKRDAEIAMEALVKAGLDTLEAIKARDRKDVVAIMCRDLQW